MTDIRLYMFQTGSLKCKVHNIKMNQGEGADYEIPVPFFLLTIDAAYTLDHWEEKALPGFMSSAVEVVHSVQKMRMLANRTKAQVVTGHDPDAWPTFRHAPEYYD